MAAPSAKKIHETREGRMKRTRCKIQRGERRLQPFWQLWHPGAHDRGPRAVAGGRVVGEFPSAEPLLYTSAMSAPMTEGYGACPACGGSGGGPFGPAGSA